MKLKKTLCLAASIAMMIGFAHTNAQANTDKINVLVVDSGSDFDHKSLKPSAKPNKIELNGLAKVDDDKNGYIDDIYGWNFVENNNILVNLEDTPPDYDTVLKVMEYVNRLQQNGKEDFTEAEWNWFQENYNNRKLRPWVNFTGTWAHGTHCAGIISLDNKAVSMNAIRHIPTGGSAQGVIKDICQSILIKLKDKLNGKQASYGDLVVSFGQQGRQLVSEIKKQAQYMGSFNPRLINCSFGTDNSSLKKTIKLNLKMWGYPAPTDKELQEIVNMFVEKALLPRDKAMFSKCKNALIFIAAGNSSENLTNILTSPNDVPIENKIVVAATDRDLKLAEFSCYGERVVDVAVPGVNIYSTYPNQKMGYMTGTSMACPNALRMASMVLDANPKLTPVELKRILMNTVDKKDWLTGKVKSGGVINVERAIEAAKQVKSGKNIADACKEANKIVPDKINRARPSKINLKDPQIKKIYFENVF